MSQLNSEQLRFLSSVNFTPSCWLWTGKQTTTGYGWIYIHGKKQGAHRVAWTLFREKIPSHLCVCHTCDVPLCVNPKHLWLGTKHENSLDMARKLRSALGDRNGMRKHPERVARGERQPRHKLTSTQVQEIRTRYASQPQTHRYAKKIISQEKLAKEFGVSFSTVHRIINKERWAHV